jgi:hypothetical protein
MRQDATNIPARNPNKSKHGMSWEPGHNSIYNLRGVESHGFGSPQVKLTRIEKNAIEPVIAAANQIQERIDSQGAQRYNRRKEAPPIDG